MMPRHARRLSAFGHRCQRLTTPPQANAEYLSAAAHKAVSDLSAALDGVTAAGAGLREHGCATAYVKASA